MKNIQSVSWIRVLRAAAGATVMVLLIGVGHWLRVGALVYSDFATMLGVVGGVVGVAYLLEWRQACKLRSSNYMRK